MLVKHIKPIVNALCVFLCSALQPPLKMPYQLGNSHFHVIATAHITTYEGNKIWLNE